MSEREEKLKFGGGIAVVVITTVIIFAVIIIPGSNNNNQLPRTPGPLNPHLINDSDARLHRFDDYYGNYFYFEAFMHNQVPGKFLTIPLTPTTNSILNQVKWNNTVVASGLNLTISQLTCTNGTYRIMYGIENEWPGSGTWAIMVYHNDGWYGYFLTLAELSIAIPYALNNF